MRSLKTPLFQYEELLREEGNINLEKMSHFSDSHRVDVIFIKRYVRLFFYPVKNDEGWMPFLLIRSFITWTRVIMAHFHLYQNSKCPKLDSALPCARPSPLSTLHSSSMCKHSPASPRYSWTFTCILLFQACLLFSCSGTAPTSLLITSSWLTSPTTHECLALPSLRSRGSQYVPPLGIKEWSS